MPKNNQVVVENVNHPGLKKSVDAAKYQAMKSALLKVLPKRPPGLNQKETHQAVLEHLPADLFPGGETAQWWAKTVQLDLEAKNVVTRTAQKPLTWYLHNRFRRSMD